MPSEANAGHSVGHIRRRPQEQPNTAARPLLVPGQSTVCPPAPLCDAVSGDVLCSARLVALQVVDPSLWSPACKDVPCREMRAVECPRQPLFLAALEDYLADALQVPGDIIGGLGGCANRRADVSRLFAAQKRGAGGSARASDGARLPSESRMVDGLTTPDSDIRSTFYDPDYRSDQGTIEFCLALPDNRLGLPFEPAALAEMCGECVVKICELGRQRVTLSPRHIAPIYAYTYELHGPDTEQIYGAMNRFALKGVRHSAAGAVQWVTVMSIGLEV